MGHVSRCSHLHGRTRGHKAFQVLTSTPRHTHAPGSGAHIVLGHWCTHSNTGLWPACKSTPRLWCLFSFDPIQGLPPSSGARSLGKHRWVHTHADLLALRHTWLVRLLAAGLLATSSVSISPTALRVGTIVTTSHRWGHRGAKGGLVILPQNCSDSGEPGSEARLAGSGL